MITLNFGNNYQRFYLDTKNNKIIQFLNDEGFCEATRKLRILEHFDLSDNFDNRIRFKRLDLRLKSHLAIFNKLARYL